MSYYNLAYYCLKSLLLHNAYCFTQFFLNSRHYRVHTAHYTVCLSCTYSIYIIKIHAHVHKFRSGHDVLILYVSINMGVFHSRRAQRNIVFGFVSQTVTSETVTSSAPNENRSFNKYKCQQCRAYLFIFDSSLPKIKFIHTTFINLESYHCKLLTLDQVPGKSTNNIPYPFLLFCLRSISKIISASMCVCVCQ